MVCTCKRTRTCTELEPTTKLQRNKMPFTDSIAKHLRQPGDGVAGAFVKYMLKRRNAYLEENAVILCDIKPDFHVLEIGFGPGIGLKKAAQHVQQGSGKIYGIDFSPPMMVEAIRNLPQEIADEKVELVLGNAASIPYRDNTMDRIFHTNCYYFWPDVCAVGRELFRVLKPGGFMVTLLNLERVKEADRNGLLKYGKWQPEPYMEALRDVGFQNTEMKSNVVDNMNFESILAYKP